LRAALLFAVAGFAWIIGSDRLIDLVVSEEVESWLQTVKGSLFIVSASLVIYVLVRRYGRQWQVAESEARAAADAQRGAEWR
jgi:hypothetical protein